MKNDDRTIMSHIVSAAIRANDRLDFGACVLDILHAADLINESEYVRLGMTIGLNEDIGEYE